MIAFDRRGTRVVAAVIAAGIELTLAFCLAASAGGQSSANPNLSGLTPRVGRLQPRVAALQPRMSTVRPRTATVRPRTVTLQPRVHDVAPKETAPNSFTVNADVLFAFDSSALSPDAQAVLAGVVQKLHSSPPGTVAIAGYTDSIGTPDYNIGLSQRRAAAVQAYLTGQVANSALQFTSQGLGESDPVAPNTLPGGQDNPAGRQQNRRVVITFTAS